MNDFWKHKKISEFTDEEWESICTNCGHCCRIKLQDEDNDEIYYTNIICRYFDEKKCLCTEYKNRCILVPSCLKLTQKNFKNIPWMPKNCAYRILGETGDLPIWHPLVSHQPLPMEYSVKNKVINETLLSEDDWEDHITDEDFNRV